MSRRHGHVYVSAYAFKIDDHLRPRRSRLSTAPRSCTNWAVIMIIILGVFFMVIPGVTLASQKIGAPTPTLRDFDSD